MQSVAMKTKWHLYMLWGVLSLGLLCCAVDTSVTRRKQLFKLDTPKSKPVKLSRTGDRNSSERSPAGTSPLSQLSPPRPVPPPTPRSTRPGRPGAGSRSALAYLPDVSVTCSTSDLVVRVKPAFYGLGAVAEELKLGSACKSNGVLRPYGDLLFTYPLTACDAVRESPPGFLLYKYVLHYEPSSQRFPSRAHRIKVNIECRYQRNHHVYQLTVQPTWETTIVHKRLKGSPGDFKMELMDDSWSRLAKSQVYQLGKTVHVQVSAPHLPTGGKLYIRSCYAAPSRGSKSLKYTIIDNFGCVLDSKSHPGASQFISRTDGTLRFSLKAFQFTSDPDTQVNIHCKLFVTSEEPGSAHKSCTYRENRWEALTGDDSICDCCDSQCVTSKPRRAMMEGSASSGSLLVSDQPLAAEDGFLPVSRTREGEATIHRHVSDNQWDSTDIVKYDDDYDEEQDYTDEEEEESGVILGVMREPDVDESGFRKWLKESEVNLNETEEDGSGSVIQWESEEEEGFDEVSLNEKEAEVLRHQVQVEKISSDPQKESQPPISEGEEQSRKQTGGGEEHDGMMVSEVESDDRDITWYFTWR
ncbi:uncharacterized protein si:ch211-67f13.7 [Centropristis striata]|uniref:uncharacterized protein si:ch211-67f13.7 n=1 Tax=Centropristis striata TaxID=184440 RepID=UPI0027DF8744|nr:uncharacterized protein si:ch211-67f13.7 [Centropristis striata]